MDPVEGRVQTRGCLAKCSCVHDGTQMAHASFLPVLYYFLLALVSPMRTEGTRGQGRRREAQVGWAGTRGEEKKRANSHREFALIKAPFYTFRWHRGITSVSRYFFLSFFHRRALFHAFLFFFFFVSFSRPAARWI